MKAAVTRGFHLPLSIENIAISKPVQREVLVRVAAVGVCHTDLHALEGNYPLPLPLVLGHEVAGVVEAVGPDVRTVKVGDHVVVCLTFHCGHCEHCESGNSHRCRPVEARRTGDQEPRLYIPSSQEDDSLPVLALADVGGFAEQVLVHESGCVPIRRDMPLDRACLIGCGVTTGIGAVTRTANVRPGDSVAIIGCGGVGLAAINAAHIVGAGRIFAIDRAASKLETARIFGATDCVDASHENVVEQVLALTNGRGVDHAIEAVGNRHTIEDAYNILAKGGIATIAGVTASDVKIEIPAHTLLGERGIRGSLMGGVRNIVDIPRYVDFYLAGKLKLDELISRRRPLSEINEAFLDMRTGELARTVITFDV